MIGEIRKKDLNPVVDALPYIDQGYDEEAEAAAMALIQEECSRYRHVTSTKYDLPPLNFNKFLTELLKAEFERIQNRQPMQGLNMRRYELPGPSSTRVGDLDSWQEALQNAKAQLEQQDLRILSLELMVEYGAEAWRMYLEKAEKTRNLYRKHISSLREKVQAVHFSRKRKQTEAGDKLKQLEARWVSLVTKNYEIEKICAEIAVQNVIKRKQLEEEEEQKQQQQTSSVMSENSLTNAADESSDVNVKDAEEEVKNNQYICMYKECRENFSTTEELESHLTKCRQSYTGPYKVCMFNGTHWLPLPESKFHMTICPSRYSFIPPRRPQRMLKGKKRLKKVRITKRIVQYLKVAHHLLKSKPHHYVELMKIIHRYWSRRYNRIRFIKKIGGLCQDYPDLISGLVLFFPTGYRIYVHNGNVHYYSRKATFPKIFWKADLIGEVKLSLLDLSPDAIRKNDKALKEMEECVRYVKHRYSPIIFQTLSEVLTDYKYGRMSNMDGKECIAYEKLYGIFQCDSRLNDLVSIFVNVACIVDKKAWNRIFKVNKHANVYSHVCIMMYFSPTNLHFVSNDRHVAELFSRKNLCNTLKGVYGTVINAYRHTSTDIRPM
ncbi:Pre-mRNA-splicing factor SPF27 [Trichinella nativa]|uniref:Pre-mRNA-splicing factor SPF27 n=1 Tax=Trichinella nativa TaxID=6335 RepID=A0A0V1LBW9_9BILA|nr:Pre-mRNA-splicing factor SPF27 [Trichinella nativa]